MAIRLSGKSEKVYTRSFNHLQNVLDVKNNLDVRELAIQFGCVRIIPFVQKGLKLYKQRFYESLPASRQKGTDFGRPVFMAVAFYLCAKKHKFHSSGIPNADEIVLSNMSTMLDLVMLDLEDPLRGGKDELFEHLVSVIHAGDEEALAKDAMAPPMRRFVHELLLKLAGQISPF